jgi:hypothetical protein
MNGINSSPKEDFTMPNTQRRIVYLWLIITMVFFTAIFIPSMIGLDGMDGGFAVSFIAGFMVIVGLIVIIFYLQRANQMDKILAGEGKIVLWRYSREEWNRFVRADFEDEKKIKNSLFRVIVVVSLIVCIFLMILLRDPLIILIVAGIVLLVAIPAYWAPRYRYRKLQHSEAVALIAEHGVIVGQMFHLWVKQGASLDSVSINTKEDPNLLEFAYSMPARHGRQQTVARVPIPSGQLDAAIQIYNHLTS